MHDTTSGDRPFPDDPTRTVGARPADAETVQPGAPPGAAAVPVPAAVGRYRVIERLGSGGFGTVYRAHDDLLAREVAVKVFHRHHVASPNDLAAYLAEGRALASLDHPGIVPVYDVGRTDDGLCYLVSRAVEGGDLKSQLHRARPTRAETVAIVVAVAEALHYAHQRGVIHRDVKPANILLDAAGRAFIGDFGARPRKREQEVRHRCHLPPQARPPATESRTRGLRGEGHRVDARTDVYSLGIVLYELLCGQLPFRPRNRAESARTNPDRGAVPAPPGWTSIPFRGGNWNGSAPKAAGQAGVGSALRHRKLALREDLRHFEQFLLGKALRAPRPASVIPRAACSFDAADDAGFFLELLPGPRDRDGLPESVRFWKSRLEAADPDESFPVGLLYGPSGCGKLIAGEGGVACCLRLAAPAVILPVYVEATPDGLEEPPG